MRKRERQWIKTRKLFKDFRERMKKQEFNAKEGWI